MSVNKKKSLVLGSFSQYCEIYREILLTPLFSNVVWGYAGDGTDRDRASWLGAITSELGTALEYSILRTEATH